MVECVDCGIQTTDCNRVGHSTEGGCDGCLVGVLYPDQRCNRPQQAVQPVASCEQRRRAVLAVQSDMQRLSSSGQGGSFLSRRLLLTPQFMLLQLDTVQGL